MEFIKFHLARHLADMSFGIILIIVAGVIFGLALLAEKLMFKYEAYKHDRKRKNSAKTRV